MSETERGEQAKREPKPGECWHDGKGVHVSIRLRNAAQTRFRRPGALSNSIWHSGDFDSVFEPCSEHPAVPVEALS